MLWKAFWRDTGGAALVEYSVLLGMIATSVVALTVTVATQVEGRFSNLNSDLAAQPRVVASIEQAEPEGGDQAMALAGIAESGASGDCAGNSAAGRGNNCDNPNRSTR